MYGSVSRFVIVGTPGSGKTTLARVLSRQTGFADIEVDTLKYEPNWRVTPDALLQDRVEAIVQDENWTMDGNYKAVREAIWSRAEMVVRLDYSFAVVVLRLGWRTLRGLLTAEQFANGIGKASEE